MFPLLRYFSIASLVAIAATTLLLGALHRYVERAQLLKIGESNHVALTQTFANTFLPSFRELTQVAETIDADALRQHPLVAAIHARAVETMQGTRAVKIKFFDLKGRTIFSTDAGQIGKDYSRNPGFVFGARGMPLSELTHRERFSAFDREIVDRDVLSSYVAMRAAADAPIEGVLEVYTDVTEWIEHTEEQGMIVMLATAVALATLYVILFFIVRRADRLIRNQYEQLRQSEEQIRRLAFHDQLTGLPNRSLQIDRIQHALALSARHGHHGALLFIDLDHFKEVNDTLGHGCGDQLLQQVAQRLLGCIRASDSAARWGGDEFVVMLENLGAEPAEAMSRFEEIAQKILGAFNQPFMLDAHSCRNTPSIGAALFRGGETVDGLLKRADDAMYAAKSRGRNQLVILGPAEAG